MSDPQAARNGLFDWDFGANHVPASSTAYVQMEKQCKKCGSIEQCEKISLPSKGQVKTETCGYEIVWTNNPPFETSKRLLESCLIYSNASDSVPNRLSDSLYIIAALV